MSQYQARIGVIGGTGLYDIWSAHTQIRYNE